MKIRLLWCAGVLLFGLLGIQETASAANGVRCEIRRRLDDTAPAGFPVSAPFLNPETPPDRDYHRIRQSNHNDEAAVGHYILLRCFVCDTSDLSEEPPDNGQGSNWKWGIDGSPIYDDPTSYTFTLPLGKKRGPPPTNLRSIGYNWYKNPGSKNLKVKVDVQGKTLKGTDKITLKAPTKTEVKSTKTATNPDTNNVAVVNTGRGRGELSLGIFPTNRGITWTGTTTAPTVNSPNPLDGSGLIGFVQLVKTVRHQTLNNGTRQQITSGGKWVLDQLVGEVSPIYNNMPAIGAGSEATVIDDDTPAARLNLSVTQSKADDSFRTYFMYRPNGAHSIFVSLSRLTWSWKGTTNRSGDAWEAATSTNSTSTDGSDHDDLPEWENYTGSIVRDGWQPVP